MARYARVLGPTADFELTAAFTPVTGLSITDYYDDGELLILAVAACANNSGVPITYRISFNLDGVAILPFPPMTTIGNGANATLSAQHFHPISSGQHTIDLLAQGNAAAGDIIAHQSAELIVIQLPIWYPPARIVTL